MTFIALGYIFIFFHITINGFDLLNNFLGCIFLIIGLTQMRSQSAHFARARRLSIPYALLYALHGAYSLWSTLSPDRLTTWINSLPEISNIIFAVALAGISLAGSILSLIISYRIIRGLRDLEASLCVRLHTRPLLGLWCANLILPTLQSLLALASSMLLYEAFTPVLLVLTILMLIVHAVFIGFLWNARTRYILALRVQAAAEPAEEPPCAANGSDE